MTYKNLIQAFNGRAYIAHELNISDQSVSMWSTNGLPKKYVQRYALIQLVKQSDLENSLKTELLDYVMNPSN